MLYQLLYSLHGTFHGLNIFKYITFRASLALLTAFVVSLIFGPAIINKLKRMKVGDKINKGDSAALDSLHKNKEGTPTMGGILILLAIILSTVLWAELNNKYILLALCSTLWLGLTGFMDDYLKLKGKQSRGLSVKTKLTSQILLGLILGTVLFLSPDINTKLDVPFLKNVTWDLGIFYILMIVLIITGSSNAVNLTDGLDGLAVGIVIMIAIAFSILSYVTGNFKFSQYLLIPYIPGAGELTVFCASIVGAGLGFLWFNCYPASVFMGDVGSLSLGGALGTVAIFIKKELLLVVVGGILVLEAFSVILQVSSFKLRKKRIFKIAPLHHHFQFLGWSETKVIVRFWIIAALLSLLTLVTLKVR